MGVGSGGQGVDRGPPWIFIYGTNIVDKGLKVLFFGVFLLFFGLFSIGPPGSGLRVLFFNIFLVFFGLFPSPPPLKIFLPTLLVVPCLFTCNCYLPVV